MSETEVNGRSAIARLVEAVLRSAGTQRRPVVTVSWAQTRDGSIAAAGGVRTPLSSPPSLALTHELRSLHAGILVGIGTVLSDDPLLNVRLVQGPSPRPIVLDSSLRMPLGARLLGRTDTQPWIFHESGAPAGKARELERRGARLFALERGTDGLPLGRVLAVLDAQGVPSVMVEGGARVLRSFLGEDLAAQAVITVSPIELQGFKVCPDGVECLPAFTEQVRESCGPDTVIWGRLTQRRA